MLKRKNTYYHLKLNKLKRDILYIYSFLMMFLFTIGCNRNNVNHVVVDNTASETENIVEENEDYTSLTFLPTDFINWINNESRFKKFIEKSNLRFELNYLPKEYFVIQELRSDEITQAQSDSIAKLYEDLIYFKLVVTNLSGSGEFLKIDKPDAHTYEERIKYYSFGWQNDIKMFTNNDSSSCAMLHFERSYDINNQSTMLLAFPKISIEKDIRIIIRDSVFVKEKIEFKYKKEDLNNLPQLKTI